MRAVFRFSKFGAARWISHLDLMRAMARAVRRAGLPAKYTQGFHPHIGMSFAQALGVGYLSVGEYMEMGLDDCVNPAEAVKALNEVLPRGIGITGVWKLGDDAPTLMAAVEASRWLIEFDGPADEERLAKFRALLDRDVIEVVKEGPKGPKNMDIRPGIYLIEPSPQPLPQVGGGESLGCGAAPRFSLLHASLFEGGGPSGPEGVSTGNSNGSIKVLLAAGSKLNIRPELVVRAALGEGAQARAITRLELYATVNERLTPLYKICIDGDRTGCGEDHLS